MNKRHFPKRSKTKSKSGRVTKIEILFNILSDKEWHTTKELSRRVGHTFAVAKFYLTRYGYLIERRRHPSRRYQHQYRLLDSPED